MGFIPDGAKWYLAEIVEQLTVADDSRNVVHTNMVLVRADSPEEAYQKALELGFAGEQSYENPDGKLVTARFMGLRDLNVIHEELGHGAELIYSETIGMEEAALQQWVTPKESLGVFAPIVRPEGPNYASADVVKKMNQMIAESKLGGKNNSED